LPDVWERLSAAIIRMDNLRIIPAVATTVEISFFYPVSRSEDHGILER